MTSRTEAAAASNLTLPTIPDYSDDLQWVTAYLTQHMLSESSWVYAYILWIAVAAVFLLFSCSRWAGLRGGYIGALWSKWSLRRRTWRKKHGLAAAQRAGQPYKQPKSLPSNAQLLAVIMLFVATFAVAFIGPDYLAPGAQLWNLQNYPTVASTKRSSYDTSDYTFLQPQFTISKAWWTAGGRTGLIAFALFPLTVLFALKAPPFALLSSPYFVHLCFDKLAFLHRWCGFLVWFLTTLHTVFWSIQLATDRRTSTGEIGYLYAWQYEKFIFAWIAYGCFTLVMMCSLPPIRRHHYEAFYFLHIVFVPLTLIMSALHHPPLGYWCWGALALWIGERCYRFTWWLNTNGFFGGMQHSAQPSRPSRGESRAFEMRPDTLPMHVLGQANALGKLPSLPDYDPSIKAPVYTADFSGSDYVPPPGFVHAELLPGRTVRVRLVTPGFLSWAPGSHFLINIPSISSFTSHPFTAASVCDSRAHESGRELVFFIRAKKGWTKDLWDTVASLSYRGMKYPPNERLPAQPRLPERGVLMRGYVDGPFGSAARAKWGDYSSVLLIAGGSGVSFAMSVLQYMCLCMAGRDGRELGGRSGGYGMRNFKTQRVRFVWIVREFGHIHWCAKALRRCMSLVPASELQIDIFVTNAKPQSRAPKFANTIALKSQDPLLPPTPQFVIDEPPTLHNARTSLEKKMHHVSLTSLESEEDEDDLVDLSYYTSDIVEEERGELGHDEHILDLTNFEGDDDTALPGEIALSAAVKQEGQARRSFWRRASQALPVSSLAGNKHALTNQSGMSDERFDPTVRLVKEKERPRSLAMLTLNGHNASPLRHQVHSPLAVTTPITAVPPLDASDSPSTASKFVFPASSTASSSPAVSSLPTPTRTPSPSHSHPFEKRLNPRLSMASSRPSSPRPDSVISQWSDTHSLAALISEAAAQEQIRLELNEEEMIDISVVAERARAGRPVFSRVLSEEVERAKGSVIVGCCGPTSLNAVVRKNVAAQINPSRIWQGDLRGHIALVAEDFGY